MFTPGVIVISYSLRASERLYLALSENSVEYWLLSCQGSGIFLQTQQFMYNTSTLDISLTVTPKPINHTIF